MRYLWNDFVSNQQLLHETDSRSVSSIVNEHQFWRYGQVVRLSGVGPVHRVLCKNQLLSGGDRWDAKVTHVCSNSIDDAEVYSWWEGLLHGYVPIWSAMAWSVVWVSQRFSLRMLSIDWMSEWFRGISVPRVIFFIQGVTADSRFRVWVNMFYTFAINYLRMPHILEHLTKLSRLSWHVISYP